MNIMNIFVDWYIHPENYIGHEVAKLTRDVVCMTRHSSDHVSEKLVSVRIVSQGQGRQKASTILGKFVYIFLTLHPVQPQARF